MEEFVEIGVFRIEVVVETAKKIAINHRLIQIPPRGELFDFGSPVSPMSGEEQVDAGANRQESKVKVFVMYRSLVNLVFLFGRNSPPWRS
jgi:hypothetical protein